MQNTLLDPIKNAHKDITLVAIEQPRKKPIIVTQPNLARILANKILSKVGAHFLGKSGTDKCAKPPGQSWGYHNIENIRASQLRDKLAKHSVAAETQTADSLPIVPVTVITTKPTSALPLVWLASATEKPEVWCVPCQGTFKD